MEKTQEKIEEISDAKAERSGSFRRICVFCGSSAGNRPSFTSATLELGKQLVNRKIDLIYGGGSIGLMGLISQTVFNGGCHVLGVIPTALLPLEISGETTGEVKTVADMHERKSEMAKHADAFIALPGGYGTMEELLEIIAWSQLGIHEKPVGLLNVDGYYNSLLALFDKGVEEGFIENSARHIVVSAETVDELMRKLEVIDGGKKITNAVISLSNINISVNLLSLVVCCNIVLEAKTKIESGVRLVKRENSSPISADSSHIWYED